MSKRLDEMLPVVFASSLAAGASTMWTGSFPLAVGLGLAGSSFGGFGNLALRLAGIVSVLGDESQPLLKSMPTLQPKQKLGLFAYFYRKMSTFAVASFGISCGAYYAAASILPLRLATTNISLPPNTSISTRTALLAASGFSFIGVPYTFATMMSTIKSLLKLADDAPEEQVSTPATKSHIDKSIAKWIALNDLRYLFNLTAWLLAFAVIAR